MTQEEKDLLLKDLCARLPYNPLISINGERYRMEEIRNALIGINKYKITVDGYDIEYMNIKPYLFPLSSMTEEHQKEMSSFDPFQTEETKTLGQWAFHLVDFYNKHHFDYRGLIEKGLALDATELNIY